MGRSWKYRVIAYVLVTLAAGVILVPSVADWLNRSKYVPQWFTRVFNRKIVPGIDLRGGFRMVYTVDLGTTVPTQLSQYGGQIEEAYAKLAKDKKAQPVKTQVWGQDQNAELHVLLANAQDAKQIDAVEKQLELFPQLTRVYTAEKPTELVYRVDTAYFEQHLKGSSLQQIADIVKKRVDSSGVGEVPVLPYRRAGTDKDAIVVEVAIDDELMNAINESSTEIAQNGRLQKGSQRLKEIRELIEKTARLSFKLLEENSAYMQQLAVYAATDTQKKMYPGLETRSDVWTSKKDGSEHADVYIKAKDQQLLRKFIKELPAEYQAPVGYEILLGEEKTPDQLDRFWRTYYVNARAEVTGEMLVDAKVGFSQRTPEVGVVFNTTGAALFQKLTKANVGRRMPIVMDDRVISAPTIEGEIPNGRGRITLTQTDPKAALKEAQELAAVLRAGALPASLTPESENYIQSTLGPEVVHKARTAMLIGALAVVLFMLIYYRLSGLIANIAMVLNVLLLLALLALFQATLTLPGIAAVVLTVGMAVDANIIIYERIREELRAGRSARGAVEAGFNRAFWTVFDAHVTNLIAGVVLYSYGTEYIRGFAVSLVAGVICNLFTSVWLSRAMFEWWVGRKKTATLSI